MSLIPLTGSASISGVATTTAVANAKPLPSTADTSAVGGGAAGAYMVQDGGSSTGSSLLKKVAIGAVVGAGLGFGASFLPSPFLGLTLPAAPILAAIGAGVGAIGGLAAHFISQRKQNLAMQAQAEAQATQQQAAMTTQPTTVTTTGPTLKIGSSGTGTRTLQSNLKSLGLFPHPVSGSFDKPTSNAIRRYEVLKGVVPTGLGSPDVRAAVAQDAKLAKQYV
jgi:hypothetical protein